MSAVNRSTVTAGLTGMTSGSNTRKKHPHHMVCPSLLRGLKAVKPKQIQSNKLYPEFQMVPEATDRDR